MIWQRVKDIINVINTVINKDTLEEIDKFAERYKEAINEKK